MSQIICREATGADVSSLVFLAEAAAIESGCQAIFDEGHATRHMRRVIEEGVAFVAEKDKRIIGTITCMPIDAGFAILADFETTHAFYLSTERSFVAVAALFRHAESYMDARGLALLVAQCDYRAAIAGMEGNGRRVEKLYTRLGYKGPVGIIYKAPQYVRVGVCYLFDGEPADETYVTAVPDVRRRLKRDE